MGTAGYIEKEIYTIASNPDKVYITDLSSISFSTLAGWLNGDVGEQTFPVYEYVLYEAHAFLMNVQPSLWKNQEEKEEARLWGAEKVGKSAWEFRFLVPEKRTRR